MINNKFNTTATVKRQTTYVDAGFNKIKLVTNGTVDGYLQENSAEKSQLLGLAMGKNWTFFCDDGADIKESDVLVISQNDYSVSKIWNLNHGLNKHKEVIIIKDDE